MFAGFLGLTILGDCVSADSMKMEPVSRGRSRMARNLLPAPLLVVTDFQLLNPITVVFAADYAAKTPTPGRFGL
jgi:hypothetical protein